MPRVQPWKEKEKKKEAWVAKTASQLTHWLFCWYVRVYSSDQVVKPHAFSGTNKQTGWKEAHGWLATCPHPPSCVLSSPWLLSESEPPGWSWWPVCSDLAEKPLVKLCPKSSHFPVRRARVVKNVLSEMRANAGDKDGKSFSMKDAYQILDPNKEEYENSQMKNIWCQHIFLAYLKQPPPFFFFWEHC